MRFSILVLIALWAGLSGLAASDQVQYSYDDLGQLITAQYDSGITIHYTYDSAGNLTRREVTVNSNSLYIPFFQASPQTFLGVAVSNYSNQAASLQFRAFDASGTLLPYPDNPASWELGPASQRAQLASQIFATGSAAQDGWIEVSSDQAELGSFFQFGNLVLTELDGSTALVRHNRHFYMSRVNHGSKAFQNRDASTYLSLANPSGNSVEVRLRLHLLAANPTGIPGPHEVFPAASETTISLPSKGVLYQKVSDLFGVNSIPGGYIEGFVTEGEGIVAFELIELPGPKTVLGLNASFGNSRSELYSAQLVDASSIFTNLKLINVSDQPRRARISAIASDGTDLAAPRTITLEQGQQVELDMGQFFSFPTQSAVTVGSLQVQANGPGIIGDVTFGDPLSHKYAASLALQSRKLTRAVFSQMASTADFFTGLAFFNPNQESAEIAIQVFTQAGTKTGEVTLNLGAGRRESKLVEEYVNASMGQVGGYIVIESTQPIIAQQIFGESHLNQFSAVPPRIIR